jgi:hypothetical protein
MKLLPRSRIAEYIKECEAFQDEDQEEVMKNLESGQLRLELFLMALGDTSSLRKYGWIYKNNPINSTEALMKCCVMRGMMTQKV